MRFSNAFVAAAAAYLLPLASADDASASASSAASSAASEVAKPAFTPTVLKAPFFEQFTDDWETRWKPSHAKKETDKAKGEKEDEEWAYVGTWSAEEPTVYPSIEGDNGLVMKDQAAHHAISAQFAKKIDPKGKDLVVQYEVKLQDGLECGGAYLKLLKDTKNLKQDEFSNASPYVIMFGPDKCGSTNKVHFIFKHKNPKSGEYEEKHLTSPPSIINDKNTNLYTLHVKPDNSFQLRINGESKRNGTLLDDFSPAVEPPSEIDDPKDKKPADWVDEATIADPDAKKPEDWDEDAPREIEDMEAEKPEDWLDDEPLMVPDPEAEKPEDWDDEEDGDWAPPMVTNPKCAEASGCGEWTRPMKKNPDFKGKWHAPQIDNPAYKGVWKPRRITNPEWFKPKDIAAFEPMGALGIELWSMQANILFDNIYIGHSIEDAEKLQKETFDIKHAGEEAQQAAETAARQAESDKYSSTQSGWFEDPVGTLKEKSELFMTVAQRDPVEAIKLVPEVAGAIGVLVATLLALLLGGVGAASSSPQVQAGAQKAKEKATEAKDKTADAVASGADKAQEATKRATRSTSS